VNISGTANMRHWCSHSDRHLVLFRVVAACMLVAIAWMPWYAIAQGGGVCRDLDCGGSDGPPLDCGDRAARLHALCRVAQSALASAQKEREDLASDKFIKRANAHIKSLEDQLQDIRIRLAYLKVECPSIKQTCGSPETAPSSPPLGTKDGKDQLRNSARELEDEAGELDLQADQVAANCAYLPSIGAEVGGGVGLGCLKEASRAEWH
jgi:hypothetical protein